LQKPSKRNVEQSRNHLLDSNAKYKLNSDGDFFYEENYLKINNTNLPADETARRIVEEFGFNAVDVITYS
jgi:hypothetical protein